MHFQGQRLVATVNAAFAARFLSAAEIEAEREGHAMILEYVLAKLVLPEVGVWGDRWSRMHEMCVYIQSTDT